jgi:hypothetical protein
MQKRSFKNNFYFYLADRILLKRGCKKNFRAVGARFGIARHQIAPKVYSFGSRSNLNGTYISGWAKNKESLLRTSSKVKLRAVAKNRHLYYLHEAEPFFNGYAPKKIILSLLKCGRRRRLMANFYKMLLNNKDLPFFSIDGFYPVLEELRPTKLLVKVRMRRDILSAPITASRLRGQIKAFRYFAETIGRDTGLSFFRARLAAEFSNHVFDSEYKNSRKREHDRLVEENAYVKHYRWRKVY